MSKKNKAVFLDRDGTINYDYGYIHEAKRLRLIRNAGKSLKNLAEHGYKLIVITNQSGIGRGYFNLSDAEAINATLNERLKKLKVQIDKFYICPHAPNEDCQCRKPSPAMILQAAHDHNIDLTKSYMIGDKISDVECGKNAGVRSFMITKTCNINYWTNYILEHDAKN